MAIGGPGAPALGANNTCTEHYDGSTWTVASARITANSRMSGFGTQNEASIVGGTTDWDNTEHFDGTAWSAGVATPTVRGSAVSKLFRYGTAKIPPPNIASNAKDSPLILILTNFFLNDTIFLNIYSPIMIFEKSRKFTFTLKGGKIKLKIK